MHKLVNLIKLKTGLVPEDIELLEKLFFLQKVEAKTMISYEGQVERYVHFLNKGIVKGYHHVNGKVIVGHLIEEGNFFSSFQSFTQEVPAPDNFETITACEIYKISKPDFLRWRNTSGKWDDLIQEIINDHLNCKLQRVTDFQTQTATERYLKFAEAYPNLILNVKVDTIASFLGIEPQSLSRIRRKSFI